MAQSKADQRANYPLAAYNFRVTVDGTSMSFAKVTGLQREYKTVTYAHGLSYLEGPLIAKYDLDKYVSVTLERGVVTSVNSVYDWLADMNPRSVEVSLCDEQGVPVLAWRIAKALAVKLSAPSFDAQANQVAIESLELKVAGVSIVNLA
jgi:phage tail-like protein